MARKPRKMQDSSGDDEAPEVMSHLASKADVKRNQKALRDFETEEMARRKTRNRERDQKLKERARLTRGGKKEEKQKGSKHSQEREDQRESGDDEHDDLEARMVRAMMDAENEVDSGEREEDEESAFGGSGQERHSDSSFAQDEDARMSQDSNSFDPESPTDDEEVDKDDEASSFQANIPRSSKNVKYLADDLFAAAFASQKSKPLPKESVQASQQQTTKKRRRKYIAHPKDLVVGGRTIRTLPRPSDPRSQATARTVPSARARRFVDQSLAMKGKQALIKAKKRGWERRPANVGVMKYRGAPHGFARSTR